MKRSRRATREKWQRIIVAQEASGKTAAAYCRENGIGTASFYAWKRRLGRRGKRLPAMGFVELTTRTDRADAQRAGAIEVVVGRRRVLVRRGFDPHLVSVPRSFQLPTSFAPREKPR